MKLISLFLLFAGWTLVVAALAMLRSPGAQNAFLLAGVAIEALGLGLLFRAHLEPAKERR